jgi:HCNGP-like protein
MDGLVASAYASSSSSPSSSASSQQAPKSKQETALNASPSATNDANDDDGAEDDFRIVSITAAVPEECPVDSELPKQQGTGTDPGLKPAIPQKENEADRQTQPRNQLESWVATALDLRESRGLRFDENLRSNARFQNPAICAKMIAFCGLAEHGSHAVPRCTPPEECEFYDQLAERQIIMSERQAQQQQTNHQ